MIPEELKALHQWVCAKSDSKNPWQARRDEPASVSNPATWSSYEEAEDAVMDGRYDYVGFVFNDNGIVGIDLDHAVEGNEITESARDILLNTPFESYVEFSRSGHGFHLLMYGDIPFDGRNNQHGVEIYKKGRYFIITGMTVSGEYMELRNGQETIDYTLEKYFPEMQKDPLLGIRNAPRIYNPLWRKPAKGDIPLRPKYPEIGEGARNICLTSLAGLMRTQGYNKRQIYAELLYANQTACHPPLSTREIQNIVTSVERYER